MLNIWKSIVDGWTANIADISCYVFISNKGVFSGRVGFTSLPNKEKSFAEIEKSVILGVIQELENRKEKCNQLLKAEEIPE